ncbi:aurora kinase [Rhipicephalus sanguineus]|uniref:aurora kinase n=1 Tax=Rhipicephalus sanguineus TaxID=34632 RepID=UPI0020C24EF4|nr:aurora kinase [Rhipicephalus sanguineus]
MLTCADTPLPTLHTLAPGLFFTCHLSKRSSARNAPVTPPIKERPPKEFKRIPRRRSTCARAPLKWTQAAATQVPALSAATTSQESAPRTPRSDAGQLLQAPRAAQPGRATTPFRGTSEADGERTSKQTTAVTPGGAHGGGSKAGSPMRRNSPPAVPGPSGVSPATPAQQPASPVDEAAVRDGEAEDSNSLKWMSTKEPGAKVKRREDEASSAGPSHVQLQSPAASPAAPKKRTQRLPHGAPDTVTKKSSGGSRTELCGILSGLLGRFRIKSISLGDVDEVTFWKNPSEPGDWHLSFLQQHQVLGRGSFGIVYLVRHKVTKELAALKCIEKHHREQTKEARRVEAERLAWQAVSHHPFVATLKCYYETTKAWCFVMEYVPRGTLSQIIRRSGPLPENRAKVVSAQLAHALNFVHEAGYLHRDISSSNVLLDEHGDARLIDFGLCQLGMEARNRCGSLAYMAPEVLRREHYGAGADWWSFGIVLYTMLIGKTPLSQYAAEQNINIQTTRRELRYSMALAAPLRFPRSLTDEAYNILQEILREDPSMRLGCRVSGGPSNSGFQEMMQHRFFATIDWRALIGDVRLNPRTGSRNPREDAAASGSKP